MVKDFDVTPHAPLIRRAAEAFLQDTSYAIAIAKPAGALAARRTQKSQLANTDPDAV